MGDIEGMIREGFSEKEILEKKPEGSDEACGFLRKSIPGLGNGKTSKKMYIEGMVTELYRGRSWRNNGEQDHVTNVCLSYIITFIL